MSSAWQNRLRDAWAELARHSPDTRQFRTKRLCDGTRLDAYAAIRAKDDAPGLVLHAVVMPDVLFEVGGMRLSVAAGEPVPLLVLSLEDRERSDLFATVCADALAAADDASSTDALNYFLARLNAWRRFLRERRSGLSREETIGLIGELTIYERLLSAHADAQASWQAPDDGLHDFMRNGHAIEVKASVGPSFLLRISSLDQLEATGLRRLNLVHVRLIESPDGRTIADFITSIAQSLPDENAHRAFENALLRRGLMPDDDSARTRPRVQLRAIESYQVNERFPRLTRAAVPAEVTEAIYSLEVRSISPHAIDTDRMIREFACGGVA